MTLAGFGILIALALPRLLLIVLLALTDLPSRAFDTWIIPRAAVIGLFVLPWTTLVYAAAWNWSNAERVRGLGWVLVAIAFLADLTPLWIA